MIRTERQKRSMHRNHLIFRLKGARSAFAVATRLANSEEASDKAMELMNKCCDLITKLKKEWKHEREHSRIKVGGEEC